ncbi:hypothetical protein [Haliscomenobacter hydrossis]|uniref:NERD domain-containing protein n=1 Tax=Haliscomenobacter hydrossis (strain ATCC 27775 / DSM 1100 / LMG 10767 / O) TaxID=760192 RepID=F4L256_HALH1|nr:hypothetical protein [Haliscomenobacter hydrossis]AEE51663.1 hypothetical protein Halhy_3811 [Haliscomenobacter hydrossis DSM 1100]
MTFHESGLVFRFPEDWLVRKFDSHTFYRGLSGFGFKAVDFIVLPPEGPLLLLEVKNYFNRDPRINAPVPPELLPIPAILADKLHEKSADTLEAILKIQRYYFRKWSYRLLLPWLFRLRWKRSDWVFWTLVHQRAHVDRQAQFVCWLESDDGQTDWKENLTRLLKAMAFDPPFEPLIVSINENPFFPNIVVEELKS